MNVQGVLIVDGKEHKIDARDIKLQVEFEPATAQATRNPQMGTQVTESFSISGGTLVTSSTVRTQDGKTSTTTTTTSDSGSMTTTTTSDGNGTTTDIKITRK